jgi:hypothetical protein
MSLSTIPPALAYLTIYNPTLKPAGPVAEHDEDAAEQAHILFYTARERAVSRDRILRQVGLAKALVNFAGCVRAHGFVFARGCVTWAHEQDVQRGRAMHEHPLALAPDGRVQPRAGLLRARGEPCCACAEAYVLIEQAARM